MLETLAAAREFGEIAALECLLHGDQAIAGHDLGQRLRLQIAHDLIAMRVVAAVRDATVGEDHHPGEECPLHAAVKLAVQIRLFVDVERFAGLLDDPGVPIAVQIEEAVEVVDRLVEREA